MQKREKIGIAILAILIIVLVCTLWFARVSNPHVKINCNELCIQIGGGNWFFPGSNRVAPEGFYEKEGCIAVCQNLIKK